MAKKLKLVPFGEIEKRWMKNPEFRRVKKEREPQFKLIQQLVKARIKQGKTQAEVAKKAGLTQEAVAQMESFSRDPRWSTVCKMAKSLDLDYLEV